MRANEVMFRGRGAKLERTHRGDAHVAVHSQEEFICLLGPEPRNSLLMVLYV